MRDCCLFYAKQGFTLCMECNRGIVHESSASTCSALTLNFRGDADKPHEICRDDYEKLKAAGFLWEFYPDAPAAYPQNANNPATGSNGSLKFQDGICHDCESPDLCIQDNGCHNTGKVFSRIDHPSQQWQPIETYPKNGKAFMCIDTAGNIDIQWHPMVPAPEEYTHWMPLPAPPMSDK